MAISIKQFQKSDIKELRSKMTDAMSTICKEMGIESLEIGTIHFTDATCSMKITGKLKSNVKAAIEHNAFHASLFGLPADVVGRQFSYRGQSFTIDGIDLKKRRYPVLAHDSNDGRKYKFTAEDIKPLLK